MDRILKFFKFNIISLIKESFILDPSFRELAKLFKLEITFSLIVISADNFVNNSSTYLR